jgi:hypothetical protein
MFAVSILLAVEISMMLSIAESFQTEIMKSVFILLMSAISLDLMQLSILKLPTVVQQSILLEEEQICFPSY